MTGAKDTWVSHDGSVMLYLGDCLDVLRSLPSESVQTCVTSPPYYGLRDYGTAKWEGGDDGCDHKETRGGVGESSAKQVTSAGASTEYQYRSICAKCGAKRIDAQIGLEQSPDEYVQKLVEVFREVRRVLRDDGTLWLNLGDSYAGGGRGGNPDESPYRKQATNKGSLVNPSPMPAGLKPKDLIGIPWRVAFALQADGWYLRQDIIWHKPNPMPESVTDRCTKSHEYIFLLSKSARYFYDAEAIKELSTVGDNGSLYHTGKTGEHQMGRASAKPRKSGNKERRPRPGSPESHNGSQAGSVPWEGLKRNKRSVWTVTTKPYSEAHFATYPPDLIKPCVLAGSSDKSCSKCGKPWEREAERSKTFESGSGRSGNAITGKQDLSASETNSTPDIRKGPVVSTRTVGFSPACSCNAEPVPSTVLDPFSGAGTTALVSYRLGRKSIGIELNPEYRDIAITRIEPETRQYRMF